MRERNFRHWWRGDPRRYVIASVYVPDSLLGDGDGFHGMNFITTSLLRYREYLEICENIHRRHRQPTLISVRSHTCDPRISMGRRNIGRPSHGNVLAAACDEGISLFLRILDHGRSSKCY